MTPQFETRLKNLVARTRAASKVEVLCRALALYDIVVETYDNGGSVVFRDELGKVIEVRIPTG